MGKHFGTDGVRGVANDDLTPEYAMKIGKAGAFALAGHLGRQAKILVGTDTRISADMLEAALVAGLCSVGAEVYRAGVVPSPAMAYLVRHYKMDAGVMLSASHNPMPDNGIKFFNEKGYKLSDEIENTIETYIDDDSGIPRPVGEAVGRAHDCGKASSDYADFLIKSVTLGSKLTGIKVALDCANGACSEVAPEVFRKLGAEVIAMHDKPDGKNINVDCGSTHLQSLTECVKAEKADIGLAFDGDGDRILCVDERGEAMDGDAIMAICGLALKQKGKLSGNAIVATVMSNMGLAIFCECEGIELRRTAVGDRYVVQEMLEGGYSIGGEQSGHIILHDHNSTGDGILTGLQLLSTLKESGKTASELRKVMQPLPQVLLGTKLKKRLTTDVRENAKIAAAIADVEKRLGSEGRVLVRASGTEPLVRVMLEGRDEAQITEWAQELVNLIAKEF